MVANMSSHKHHNIVLMLLFINAHVYAVLGLHCLSCSDAVTPTDCDTVQLCSSHESCFIEVFVLNTGHIRYKMGCRDIKQCTSVQSSAGRRDLHIVYSRDGTMNSQTNSTFQVASTTFTDSTPVVAHRRSQDLLVCSDCCTKDLCNSAGCGQTGYIYPRGPICFHCSQQQTPDDCNKITMCGENQVCMLSKIPNEMTHVVRYQTHCEEENVCRKTESAVSLIFGKRQLGGGSCVASCCKTDLCNWQCSSTAAVISSTPQSSQAFTPNSVGTITPMLPNDPCLSNPCMRGTCSADQNTYRCTCEPGYAGQQCDQVYSPPTQSALTTQTSQITVTGLDACLSNPCMWGQCSPILTTYKCTCDHGYWGRNCEKDATGTQYVTVISTSLLPKTTSTVRPTTITTTIVHPTTTSSTTVRPTTATTTVLPSSTCPTKPPKIPLHSNGVCEYRGKQYTQSQYWTDGCQYNCTCEDAAIGYYRCRSLCPQYTNLPPDCKLIINPIDCCAQPDCGMTQVSTIAPVVIVGGTSFCFYKGEFYTQDQTWTDGCSHTCTCIDADQGMYCCTSVCLEWNSLPSICHLVDAPPGLCCQQLKCPKGVIINIPKAFKDQYPQYPGYNYV